MPSWARSISVKDVSRTGIRGINLAAVNLAGQDKKVVRLIGEVTDRGGEVSPRLIPVGHPLSIGGTLNTLITSRPTLAGEITVAGRGAGRAEGQEQRCHERYLRGHARKASAISQDLNIRPRIDTA